MASSAQSVLPFSLTTTFIAPTECAQANAGLTMLQNDGFRLWLNAPLPVPGTTISSCYPSQFISSFLLQKGGLSQAPFSGLVCPEGYTTQGPFTSNYIACCPSGWDGFAPATNAPSDRPAFGGTCYTNIFNVPVKVTSYDNESLKASSIFTATNSQDQAFAYPYEGFALGVAVLASTTGSLTSRPTATNTLPTASSSVERASSSERDPGVIAGTVIGSIAAALFLTGAILLMLNYRKRRLSSHGSNHRGDFPDYASHIRLNNDSPTPMVYLSQPPQVWTEHYRKEMDMGGVNRYENAYARELDGNKVSIVHEMDGGNSLPAFKSKELPRLPPAEIA